MPTAANQAQRNERARLREAGLLPPHFRVGRATRRMPTQEELEELMEDRTPVHGWKPGLKVVVNNRDRWVEDEIERLTTTTVVTKDNGRFRINPTQVLSRRPADSWAPTTFLYKADAPEARKGLHRQQLEEFQRQRMRGVDPRYGQSGTPGIMYVWARTGKIEDYKAALEWMQNQQALVNEFRAEWAREQPNG